MSTGEEMMVSIAHVIDTRDNGRSPSPPNSGLDNDDEDDSQESGYDIASQSEDIDVDKADELSKVAIITDPTKLPLKIVPFRKEEKDAILQGHYATKKRVVTELNAITGQINDLMIQLEELEIKKTEQFKNLNAVKQMIKMRHEELGHKRPDQTKPNPAQIKVPGSFRGKPRNQSPTEQNSYRPPQYETRLHDAFAGPQSNGFQQYDQSNGFQSQYKKQQKYEQSNSQYQQDRPSRGRGNYRGGGQRGGQRGRGNWQGRTDNIFSEM